MNPCRCGYLGDAGLACARAPKCAADYQAKVSGPLLDRIDLHVEVQAVSAADVKHGSKLEYQKSAGIPNHPVAVRPVSNNLKILDYLPGRLEGRKSAVPFCMAPEREPFSPRLRSRSYSFRAPRSLGRFERRRAHAGRKCGQLSN